MSHNLDSKYILTQILEIPESFLSLEITKLENLKVLNHFF